MNFQKIGVPLAGVLMVVLAYRFSGWGGVAVVSGAMVMWVLLNFTRMVQILKRAGHRPVGYVGSAVMLNAKLKPRASLLHVVAMTSALGELRSPQGEQPEIFRWTDGTGSYVDCTFVSGKLASHQLTRPQTPEAGSAADDSGQDSDRPAPAP